MMYLTGALLLISGFLAGLSVFYRRLSKSTETKLSDELGKKNRELEARAENAETENRTLGAVLDSMPQGLMALDSGLNITLVNPGLRFIFGYEKDSRNMSLLEFSRSEELEKAAMTVLSTGRPFEFTLKRYVSGTERHFRVFVVPLLKSSVTANSHGEVQGLVIVLEDISRLARLEQVRRDFVANVSHELRTPIQLVKGFAENILNSSPDKRDDVLRFAGIIMKNAVTMENLTGDLLTLVGLEEDPGRSSSGRPSMEDSDLAPLIAEAAGMVETAARKKNISIKIICPQDLRAKLNGPLFTQAMINLLDNGVKYSGAGSKIKVSAYMEGGQLLIKVKDKGIGIPAEHLGRIFERFYRVDKAHSRAEGGTGLGLAIVRHIVLLHSGTVEAESHAGEGSVFTMRLPANSSETVSIKT